MPPATAPAINLGQLRARTQAIRACHALLHGDELFESLDRVLSIRLRTRRAAREKVLPAKIAVSQRLPLTARVPIDEWELLSHQLLRCILDRDAIRPRSLDSPIVPKLTTRECSCDWHRC